MKEIFKSTPNLNNKEGPGAGGGSGGGGKRSPGGGVVMPGICPLASHHLNHTRSTSYSVSYCMRKATGSPANVDTKGIRPLICSS